MMYPLKAETPATSGVARCPRCAFPLGIIPKGADAPAFHRALGEVLEFLVTAQDMLTAIQGTVEREMQP